MNLASNYPLISRQANDKTNYTFTVSSQTISQNNLNIVAGLNAVDNPKNVELVFKKLHSLKLQSARMGAFKPRTSPYSFQGLGEKCLPYVFELAVKYNITLLAMEITHESQLDLIHEILVTSNNPTKILVQIGTRNAQNFELLKALGSQNNYPILYKRGFGITLEESIAACEYLALSGNTNIVFCLRGMKSHFATPHRNFVDAALIPAIKRLTKMPVCFDPSHSVGILETDIDAIPDIWHATAQAVIAGVNMLLIDVHPNPENSLVDAKQALSLDMLDLYVEDINLCRETYLKRCKIIMQKS